MLGKISRELADALDRAEAARARANNAPSEALRMEFAEIEAHWLRLAECARFIEQLDLFLRDAERNRANAE